MGTGEDLADAAERLTVMAEELAELALDRLRTAADPDDPRATEAAAEERRITRARRSVERAIAVLGRGGDDDGSE